MWRAETYREWLIDDGGHSREFEIWLWRFHLRIGWRTTKQDEKPWKKEL